MLVSDLVACAQVLALASNYSHIVFPATASGKIQKHELVRALTSAEGYADTVALFQALGGGWWNRTDVAVNSTDCCKGQ